MSVHEVMRYTKIQIRNKILITGHPLVVDVLDITTSTMGWFLPLLTGSWHCASQQPVHRCEAHSKFADESICLLADNVWNEVVTIHRPQMVLEMLSLYKMTFLAPVERVLVYPLMFFCRNICHFPKKIFF
jgi:hypothetical protein